MAMYRNPLDRPLADLRDAGPPVLSARLGAERHVIRPLSPEASARVQDAIAGERLYIADGHHRYETALAYRNERRDAAARWTEEEPENFVLAAIIDTGDPGLVVLPIHRLLKMPAPAADFTSRLTPTFDVADAGDASSPAAVDALVTRMARAGHDGPAFGAVGLRPRRLHLITLRDPLAIERLVPPDDVPAWGRLDVNVLHNALFPALGNLSQPDEMEFTEDAHEAAAEVLAGHWDVSLLLNPTAVSQVLACADAGERMPQKSTFFYPKLATGVVMYPLD